MCGLNLIRKQHDMFCLDLRLICELGLTCLSMLFLSLGKRHALELALRVCITFFMGCFLLMQGDLAQSAVAAAPSGVVAEPRSRGSGQSRQADSRWDGPWQ